jgi:hypothetical protein
MDPEMREFFAKYNQWWNKVYKWQQLKNNPNQRLTPYKFGSHHSRVSFGCNNQLITVSGTSVIVHKLKSTLIEAAESTLINTWPGPLLKGESVKEEVIEYIKGQERCSTANPEQEYYYLNIEKRQIWQLLAMMVKQNGVISSSELAEFLIHNNESEFGSDDLNSEVGRYRRFLVLGQKKIALDFARKCGLWGHKFALAYLSSNPQFSEAMVGSVNDFVDSTLSKDDPIFTLYRCLLQQLQKYSESRSIGNIIPPSNLQQFTILLANGCDVNPSIGGSAFNSEVLKFVVALRNNSIHYIDLHNSENYLLRNQLKQDDRTYNEEILFMNEIYEFSNSFDQPLLQIVPFKTIFACKLYDYGLFDQARKYCEFIRRVYEQFVCYASESNASIELVNWDLVLYLIDSIENRLNQNDNYPTIDYAYSATLDSSQASDTAANEPEYSGRNTSCETTSVDSKFDELALDSNPASPLKRPTSSAARRPTVFAKPLTSNDHVDNAIVTKAPLPVASTTNRRDFGKTSRPSSSAEVRTPKASVPSAPAPKAPVQPSSFAASAVIAPPPPSSSSVSSNVLESTVQPPTPSSPISHTKIKPQAKPVAPMPTFFVPEPLPQNAAEPVFDFVSQAQFTSDSSVAHQPIESTEDATASHPPTNQFAASQPASFAPSAHHLQPFEPKDHLGSLNSTTNGYGAPAYIFSPAMSPIGSPDPSSYAYKEPQNDGSSVAGGPINAPVHNPASDHGMGVGPSSSGVSNGLPSDKKTKGMFTSINSW